uniref:YBL03.19 protein n=1 Tax=Saccharomyces cerevisiae TaxID=4932 RepID=E9PA35_YEASX|nr:YBL03.19 [Saccharomyces cerevisiae]
MLSLIYMRGHRNNGRDTGRVYFSWSCRGGMHDGQLCISQEISRSTQPVQHTGTIHICRIGVRVNVNFYWGIHGDDTQSTDHFRIVRDNLRSQTQSVFEIFPVCKGSVETLFSQSHGSSSGVVQRSVLEKIQERVLQHFRPYSQVLELGASKPFNDSVSNVTYTTL